MTMSKKAKKTSRAAPTKTNALSREDKMKLFLTPCKTKEHFQKWVKYFFKVDLPDFTVSRYADTNPLDAAWLVYDICVNKHNPDNIQELLYVASRGSGKTLGMGVAELAVLLHDKRSVVHVGAILTQAKRCYKYQEQFLLNNRIRPLIDPTHLKASERILKSLNREKSEFDFDGEEVTLEVLPCTLKAVNGPHCPLVVVDEVDTLKGESLQAFSDIEGMLDTRGNQKALRIGISTRKTRYGLMNQQIEEAAQAGRTVFRWTVFEFSERCSDEESGTTPTLLYVKQDNMEVLTEAEWKLKDASKQHEFVPEVFPGENCRKCSLAAICWGDAKKQASKSKFLKPLADARKKVKTNGPDWALAQLVNLKPSAEGVIYREFEEKKHVKTWNEMWKLLTGTDFPGECTHDIFVKKCHQMKLTCYAGIDFGWSNPSTVVYCFIDSKENVYVVRAAGVTFTNNPTWIQMIKKKWHHMYRCQLYFIDVANPGDIVTMRMEGLPVNDSTVKGDINSGIQIIKRHLYSLASPEPKLYVAQETCQNIINEFMMYHFKTDSGGIPTDDPASEFDHWLDALRYIMYGIFGRARPILDGMEEVSVNDIVDSAGSYYKMPNAAEYAAIQGISVGTGEVDQSSIGRRFTARDLDIADEEDVHGSNGGFMWSF